MSVCMNAVTLCEALGARLISLVHLVKPSSIRSLAPIWLIDSFPRREAHARRSVQPPRQGTREHPPQTVLLRLFDDPVLFRKRESRDGGCWERSRRDGRVVSQK